MLSLSTASPRAVATVPAQRGAARILIVLALCAAALSFVQARAVFLGAWRTGAFFDSDDAMRLVQVRALLHGQGWFDMTAAGLDPPHGVFMHWSRIVDVPLALLIEGFGLITDVPTAERLARLAFPFALLTGFYLAMARLAGLLAGPDARLPAMAAVLISGNGIAAFAPGRIGHNAPRILLLVVMLGAALEALDQRRARWAALAGGLAALQLAISLENLPFIACLATGLTLIWVWHGDPMARMLGWFALGLGLALPLVFAVTVAPARYLLPVADAFGPAHLGAGLIGAIGCGAAALATHRLPGRSLRFAVASGVGALAVMFVAVADPACLRDPFAGIDPLVRDIWLVNVQESLAFPRMLREDRIAALTAIVPVTLGFGGCLWGVWRKADFMRLRFLLLAAVVALGLGMTFWQVRLFTSVTALALCGGVFAAMDARRACLRAGRPNLASLALLLLFPFTAAAWALILPLVCAPDTPPVRGGTVPSATFDACLAPGAFAPLRGLAPGAVIAPVDAGSFILAETALQVFAGPYHRDNDGNRFAFETMMAAPAIAGRMAAGRGVSYVMICEGLNETPRLAARAPGGLAAALLAGHTPEWLERLPLAATPFAVFKVRAVRSGPDAEPPR